MATKKISQLDVLSALTSAGQFEVSVGGVTYSLTAQVLYEFVAGQIASGGLDLTGAEALGFKVFAVTDSPDDWDFGWGGAPVDVTYLRGLWLSLFLDYDATYQTITHKEAFKDETALAIHMASDHFPFETFRAITLVAVQGTAARIAAGNTIGGGLPDRLIYPVAASIGGYEMIKTFADNKTMAAATSRDELDGDGARHGFDVRIHQLIDEDGAGVQTWFTGRALNDSEGPSNFPGHPSGRFGLRSTVDTSGSEPVTTLLEFVIQYAEPTAGTIAYADVLAFEIGTGLTLPAAQIGYDNAASGMTATDVQAALDELDARVAALEP